MRNPTSSANAPAVSRGVYLPSRRAALAAGQPISELMARALDNPGLISLAAGFVDEATLPAEAVRDAAADLLGDPLAARAALQYGSTHGCPRLREMLRARAESADGGAPLKLEQIVLTAGSNQLLELVSESLLDPGDIVLCGSPTYFVYLGLLAGLAARAVGVASDGFGMIPAALDEQLERIAARGELALVKAIYLVPDADNPAGTTMPRARRAAVVDIARRWSGRQRIHVISDEAYRELRYQGDDLPSPRADDADGDTVIVAGTFSKSFSPGIRVGWGILPPRLLDAVLDLKGNADFGSPNFNQQLMARVLERGHYASHLAGLRCAYREKLAAMLEAAERYLSPLAGVSWHRPAGGLYVWVQLPEHVDTGLRGALFEGALREGVIYVPGAYSYPAEGEPVSHHRMRLSFGVPSCAKIREGVEKLARAIAAVVG